MIAFIWTLIGFALGSLPFSLWIGNRALHTDIRNVGDGNPGGYNVWKAGGRIWAVLAILLDGLKGAVPVGLAHFAYGVDGWVLVPVALAPLVGHIFSPLLKFHGGKGLSTTFGIWLGLTLWLGPTVFGLSLFVWRRVFKSDRSVIVGGMLTLLAVLLIAGYGPVMALICLANMILVWWAYDKDRERKKQ
jgi:acyl phosphate:glycerol-3-phosphate acyltransferase